MGSRGEALQEWLMKSWSSDFFQALQRRIPLIVLSSLALVLASFSSMVSSSAVAWATGAGVAFMLAFLSSFSVRVLRGLDAKASVIASVYGLTGLGLVCLFLVAGEFARAFWPAGVALRIFRYGITLPIVVFSLASVVIRSRPLLGDFQSASGLNVRPLLQRIAVGGILVMEVVGSTIWIASSLTDIVFGELAFSYWDILAWQSVALVLVILSVVLSVIVGRRWADRNL